MAEVARHTAPGGSFATYTAAGDVRRALAKAGFDVTVAGVRPQAPHDDGPQGMTTSNPPRPASG